MIRIGFLHSLIRKEEKLLLEEFKKRSGVEIVMIDDRNLIFGNYNKPKVDIILERAINHSRAVHALRFFESMSIKCLNSYKTATICGDKLLTAVKLKEHNIPQPEFRVAFTEESAIKAIQELGYPVVLKPAIGSWGRLITKINDQDAAEAVIEHKKILGSYHHSIFFIQKYVNKIKNRDIRAFIIGGELIAAIYRTSNHWITNTHRGGIASNCLLNDELKKICLKTAKAVEGDILAIDLFETKKGYLVNEVNYTMEFRNSISTTGVNIPAKIVDYVIKIASEKK